MNYKKFTQSSVVFLSFLLCCLNGFAQDNKLGVFVIKTETGYLLVQNREKISYTLEFKGEEIKPLDSDHPSFIIDGKMIQVLNVLNENYWKPKEALKTEPTTEQYLEAHKMWESDYLSDAWKTKLSVTAEFLEIGQKRKAMFWSFAMPKDIGAPFSHQLFLTTLIGKDVVGINSSPDMAENQKSYRTYMVETMNTLKTSEKPFNIKELSTYLKKGETSD